MKLTISMTSGLAICDHVPITGLPGPFCVRQIFSETSTISRFIPIPKRSCLRRPLHIPQRKRSELFLKEMFPAPGMSRRVAVSIPDVNIDKISAAKPYRISKKSRRGGLWPAIFREQTKIWVSGVRFQCSALPLTASGQFDRRRN